MEYPKPSLPLSNEYSASVTKTPATSTYESSSTTKVTSWTESSTSGNTSTNTSAIPSPTLFPKSSFPEFKPTALPASEPSTPPSSTVHESKVSMLLVHASLPPSPLSTLPKAAPAPRSAEAKNPHENENKRWAERFDAAQPGGKGLSILDQEYVRLRLEFGRSQEGSGKKEERSAIEVVVETKEKKAKRFWRK